MAFNSSHKMIRLYILYFTGRTKVCAEFTKVKCIKLITFKVFIDFEGTKLGKLEIFVRRFFFKIAEL